MTKRESRKAFFHKNGIENYFFDYNEEIRIYSFLCGEKMTKKEYLKLKDNEKLSKYAEWESYVRNKYSNYPIDGLKEFSRYLNHRMRMYYPERNFIGPVASALIAAILTLLLDNINLDLPSIWAFALYALIIVSLSVFICLLIIDISKMYYNNSFKENFYKDYKEIIDILIEEKEKDISE